MEHGHCLVPRKYEKDQKLGTWVETQRVLWNRDYRKVGPKEAVQAAAATAMATSMTMAGYDGSDSKVASSMFEAVPPTTTEMAGSTEQYTHVAMLPGSFDATKFYVQSENGEGGAAPTNSVQTKVAADKGKRLTLERKQKLDELGFIWSLRSKRIEDHWDEMFKQLQAYREEHGDCLVPSRYEANLKLGKWVSVTFLFESARIQLLIPSKRLTQTYLSNLLKSVATP
jgi:Helicase associated domain